jgi:predicted acetyltransferase
MMIDAGADELKFIGPDETLREETIDFLREFREAGETYGSDVWDDVNRDYVGFVRKLRGWEQGIGLPEGYVPQSVFVLVRGRRILGACSLRHYLTPALRDFGGHASYAVRPSERGKGYASFTLRLTLEEAQRRGIERVLVTCASENLASRRVIEKNGGVLESESFSEQAGRITRRYWIELSD